MIFGDLAVRAVVALESIARSLEHMSDHVRHSPDCGCEGCRP